eukprot:scaffold19677_cov191-Skeletonema_dohrnii-CCMP3373.AAC.3
MAAWWRLPYMASFSRYLEVVCSTQIKKKSTSMKCLLTLAHHVQLRRLDWRCACALRNEFRDLLRLIETASRLLTQEDVYDVLMMYGKHEKPRVNRTVAAQPVSHYDLK